MNKKNILTGVGIILGFIFPLIGVFILENTRPEFSTFKNLSEQASLIINTRLLTFALMLDALVFFLFVKLNLDSIARGLLIAASIFLVTLVIFEFFL